MAEKTNKGLVEYARVQAVNNRPYWYGTFGQEGTEKLYKAKREQYSSQYDKWPKSSFTSQYGQKVHDCSGLIKGYMFSENPDDLHPKYNPAYDFSANGMIDACKERGDISTLPEIPGLILWKNNHVGIYAGNGKVYEAKGHSYGCITSRVQDTAWKSWGKLPFIKYEETPAPSPEPTPGKTCTPTAPVLRRGDKNESVGRYQVLANTYGAGLEVDNKFGPDTEKKTKALQAKFGLEQDGIVGSDTWSALLTGSGR